MSFLWIFSLSWCLQVISHNILSIVSRIYFSMSPFLCFMGTGLKKNLLSQTYPNLDLAQQITVKPWINYLAFLNLSFCLCKMVMTLPMPWRFFFFFPGLNEIIVFIVLIIELFFSCSVVSYSFVIPWTAAHQASLSFTISWSLLKLMSIELVIPSNHLILCRPLLLLPSVFPPIRVFSKESTLRIRWPKFWSFSVNISPLHECSGLISFRIYWFDLLAVQGTLKSLLQHHNSKASVL